MMRACINGLIARLMIVASSLSLTQKGLLIILVPLMMELMLVGVLLSCLAESEKTTREVNHARAVEAMTNRLPRVCMDLIGSSAFYGTMHHKSVLRKFNRAVAAATSLMPKLRSIGGYSKEQLRLIDIMEEALYAQIAITKLNIELIDDGRIEKTKDVILPHDYLQDQKVILIDATSLGQRLLSLEKGNTSGEKQLSQLRTVEALTMVLSITTTLFALVVAVLFVRNVTSRIYQLSKHAQSVAQQRPIGEVMSGTDELAQLDHAFHEMAAAVALGDRMKQDFVSMLGNDLRVPIHTAQSQIHTLLNTDSYEIPEQAVKILRGSERNLHRLTRLIDELLDLEKMQTGELAVSLSKVSMCEIVNESLEAVRGFARERNVHLVSGGMPPEVTADKDRIAQVLINLLSNAIKFSPTNGTVSISSELADRIVTIRISDEGAGISDQERDLLFSRFQQTSSASMVPTKGTGLGLFICHSIIRAHKGEIGVETAPGCGSTFWFSLPMPEPA